MFRSPCAADAIAMRPGLISGRHPERPEIEPGWFDRACHAMQGVLAGLTMDRKGDLRKVAHAIGQQGNAFTLLNNAELNILPVKLRRRFHRQGMTFRLCVQSFALVREMADRTLGLRHYDSQLMAGWVMLQGQLAEMATGEGKTLAATLAAATAALAGIPVHIITVNEYLVERDARAMEPLYKALGLSVGYVTQGMALDKRRAGYACDILYCTNKQVAFDYLRDRLLLGNNRSQLRLELESASTDNSRLKQLLLRGLCFAIVDEADSVLIDEARTPLILTRSVDSAAEHTAYRQALELAGKLEERIDFLIDPLQRKVQLTPAGQQKLESSLPGAEGLLRGTMLREELVCRALHALHLLHKDQDYLVHKEKVLIIDANTGRTMPDRSWERGLHQMVEAKEGCPLTNARELLGRLTYQRFFRRYLRMGGMSGTAREVGSELWSIYGLRVRQIPLHRPCRCRKLPTRVYSRKKEKWTAVVTKVTEFQKQGRPVLIGTGSVADSELLSQKLTLAKIAHHVLNARQDKAEAEIVAAAGQKGQVTVATNMAGRGTDIPLAHGVAELGGLHVIATCCNEAKRIDRQLSGRCARQGDPGSHQAILSLEDGLILKNCSPAVITFLMRLMAKDRFYRHKLIRYIIRRAQQGIERRHREARRAMLQHDRQTGRLLAFSGDME